MTMVTETELLQLEERDSRRLTKAIYIQSIFLALVYVAGTWLALTVQDQTVTTPEVMAHGVLSSSLAAMTAVVGFLALLQGRRKVAFANGIFFAYLIATAVTGFTWLGDTTVASSAAMTNLTMMAGIGLGMPITGYSLANARSPSSSEKSLVPTVVFLARGSLSLTVVVGTTVASVSMYATAVAAHVGLAALTISLVIGVLIVSLLEYAQGGSTSLGPQRVGLSLLSLTAIAIAAGDGVIAVTAGGMSYVIVMAEVTALAYAFLILASAAPMGAKRRGGDIGRN